MFRFGDSSDLHSDLQIYTHDCGFKCRFVGMEWTAARITDLLDKLRRRRGDSTTVEVKRAAGGVPQSLPETICAFANMPGGGTIVLGVLPREVVNAG